MARTRTPPPPPAARAVTADRAGRLYRLLTLLESGPQARAAIARRLKLDVRSFYRDLELLRHFGVPVASTAGKYALGEDLNAALARLPLPDPHLTLAEAAQLAKGRTAAHKKLQAIMESITGPAARRGESPA